MADVVRDEDTGEVFVRLPGNRLMQVEDDPDVIAAAQEGTVQSLVGGAMSSVGQAVTGAGALLGSERARREFDVLSEAQRARMGANPVGGTLGSLAPDVALGAVTGGTGSLARRMGTTALVEGTLGAARSPDAPIEGALIGGGLGALGGAGLAALDAAAPLARGMASRVTARMEGIVSANRARMGRDLNARRNPSPSFEQSQPVLRGFMQPEELDELANTLGTGKLYTPGDAAALRALDKDTLGRAQSRRQVEELMRTDIIMDRAYGGGASINAIRDNAQDAATRLVADELGMNDARFTRQAFNDVRRDVSADFEWVSKQVGDLDLTHDDVAALHQALDDASADDANAVKRYVENITEDVTQEGEDDLLLRPMNNEVAQQYRTRLRNDIERASKAGNFARAQALGQVQDVLDDVVERQAKRVGGQVQATLDEARHRWRIIKSIERSTATTDAGGDINVPSFMTAYERAGRRMSDDPLMKQLETLRWLTTRVVPSSGTGERVLANVSKGVGAAAATALGVGGVQSLGQ